MEPTQFLPRLKRLRPELTALALLVPLAIVLGFVLALFRSQPVVPAPTPATPASVPAASPSPTQSLSLLQAKTIALTIQGPQGTTTTRVAAAEEATVADVLRRAEAEHGLKLEIKDFGGALGIFVEGINGVRTDSAKGLSWTLSVNGTLSPLGASSARVRPGDTVTWAYGPEPHEPTAP